MKSIDLFWEWEVKENRDYDVAVVADILAATTNIAILLSKKPQELILVSKETIEKTLMKKSNAMIIGEDPSGTHQSLFSSSNHASDIEATQVKDKSVIFMTNNGTRVIDKMLNLGFKEVIPGAYVNIQEVINYLLSRKFSRIAMVASAERTERGLQDKKAMEDMWYLESLKEILIGNKAYFPEIFTKSKQFILDHYQINDRHFKDFNIIFSLNTYPVVARCLKKAGFVICDPLA